MKEIVHKEYEAQLSLSALLEEPVEGREGKEGKRGSVHFGV